MEYPKFLFKDIYWTFSFQRFNSIDKFIDELRSYHTEISTEKLSMDFDETVLEYKTIVIQYLSYQDDDEPIESQIEIIADNASGFTAKELLFKIHQSVNDPQKTKYLVKEQDNRYFEGLLFATDDDPDFEETVEFGKVPVYFLLLGS